MVDKERTRSTYPDLFFTHPGQLTITTNKVTSFLSKKIILLNSGHPGHTEKSN